MTWLATRRLEFPDSLFARIAAMLVLNLVLIWAVAFVLYRLELSHLRPDDMNLPERIASGVQALDAVPPDHREEVARAISDPFFSVRMVPHLRLEPGPPRGPEDEPPPDEGPPPPEAGPPPPDLDRAPDGPALRARILEHFPKGIAPPAIWLGGHPPGPRPGEGMPGRVVVSLRGGGWAEFRFHRNAAPFRWLPMLTLLVSTCLVISGLSLFFARGVSRRLAGFAGAAEALGRSSEVPPLKETGPREIRQATRAFNRMQERLNRFVHDRTQMLAAISHDLRTPLTRLRLRAEFVEDGEQREKMLQDLAEMEAMIAATLAFARDDVTREPGRPEDLDQLLDDLAGAMRETGREVAYQPVGPVIATISPMALRRALGNLIENAVKYGRRARIRLTRDAEHHLIEIEDDGPGIPEAMQEQVFQPFFRLEGSRNRDTGGVGLGLSVARTILRGQGGDIALKNMPQGGLRATVSLPA